MRVQQTTCLLLEATREVMEGRLVPAAFQRPYAWTRDDVEALFHSVIEGWPIGSLLLWQPPFGTDLSLAARSRIGPIVRQKDDWTSMILDGHNRLATMAWSTLRPDAPRPDPRDLSPVERETWDPNFSLVLDCDRHVARFVPSDEAVMPGLVPAAAASDQVFLNRYMRSNTQVTDSDVNWLDHVARMVRQTRMAVTILELATPAEAVRAFRHVARVGQPVSAEDVERALSWLNEDSPQAPSPGRTR